jgi:hypothetical protein
MVATAQADNLQGAPTQNGNQSFNYSTNADQKGWPVRQLGGLSAASEHEHRRNTSSVHSSQSHRVALTAPSPAHDTFAFRSRHALDFF